MRLLLKRMIATVALCGATAGLSGCDEHAQAFASKTKDILDQRSAQLGKKIAAEKAAYNKQAAHASEDHRALVESSLQNERNERSDALAVDYAEGRKPVSHWRIDLAEYAKIDYAANREMLTAEIDANSRYLQNFDDLKIEQDKVEALSKLLDTLIKKPSIKSDVAALTSFASDTQHEFDKKVCTQLQKQTSDAANAAFKAKGCDDVLKSK